MNDPALIHIDSPSHAPLGGGFLVRGWIASNEAILQIRARSLSDTKLLQYEVRPDVKLAHPKYAYHTGFRGLLDERFSKDGKLTFECETPKGAVLIERQLSAPTVPPDKAARLARIRPHLITDIPVQETPFHFNYLTPELRARLNILDTEAVSDFEYAPAVQSLIDRYRDELVLDCGAGNRPSTYPNVINLEIVAYPSTDVLAANEQLPFKDNTFSAVISCAVLEHVKDPFMAAREIIRVTKKEGVIYADIPFLQPFHGYPSHYYNMTMEGAKNLFAKECRIEKEFVPHYGLPIWALTWFLNSYTSGLPEGAREQFMQLRVADLIGPATSYLDRLWVTELSPQKNIELACTNTVVATKN
jgi:SAM-dependent methyltransferase